MGRVDPLQIKHNCVYKRYWQSGSSTAHFRGLKIGLKTQNMHRAHRISFKVFTQQRDFQYSSQQSSVVIFVENYVSLLEESRHKFSFCQLLEREWFPGWEWWVRNESSGKILPRKFKFNNDEKGCLLLCYTFQFLVYLYIRVIDFHLYLFYFLSLVIGRNIIKIHVSISQKRADLNARSVWHFCKSCSEPFISNSINFGYDFVR